MRILFGSDVRDVTSAWGGGNILLSRLKENLEKNGHDVVFELDSKCDIIFVNDPRKSNHLYSSGLPIIQRVGDIGTHSKPHLTALLKHTVPQASAVIYISHWAKKTLNVVTKKPTYIIQNVADDKFFNRKLKVVTHHWSDNPMKGKDIYERLQEDQDFLNIEFTFIGRPCFDIKKPTRHLPPMTKEELVHELPKHDFYITASKLEAGGFHVLEAMACGLPVLFYKEGGGIIEYVGRRGIMYEDYEDLASILYPMKSLDVVCDQYRFVFEKTYHYNKV